MTPGTASGRLEAQEHRDSTSRHVGQLIGDSSGIEWPEDLCPVAVIVFLDTYAVEPRAWRQLLVDPVSRRHPSRRPTGNAYSKVIWRKGAGPWPGLDLDGHAHAIW
jgi:hypothetical protein